MGIERYRAIVRLEEIRTLMEAGEYEAAKVIADSIRKERLKDSADLFLLAEVYRKCGELAAAKEFLLRIYSKKVTWRVLEELMEVCLAEKNPREAEQYLEQYVRVSGGDPRNYIYEYRIGRQKHRPDEELLPVLQTLKAEEYSEKYAYELAKLYHKLGRGQECMAECADLILWFGEGTYVERAKALQAYYRGELSAEDIRQEAERRVQEAEERRMHEEEERKAFEEKQRLLAEEQQMTVEPVQSLDEEEYRALEEVCRVMAEEHINATESSEEDVTEPASEEESKEEESEGAALFFEEVAVTEIAEPMWEADEIVSLQEETIEEEVFRQEEETVETDADAYEQMSLFAQEEELPPEPQVLSALGKELSARMAEKNLIFEDILHEFAQIERVRKQLVRMLEVVVTVRKKCHCLIITGEEQSGKTTLGTYLAKLLYGLSYVKSPRVAKISGERLNRIDLREKKEQLQDMCLIVECAGAMTDSTVEALLEFVQHTDVLGTVILEDNSNAISKLLRNHAECNRIFNNRVHLPKYDSEELLCFALEHIKGQDYGITRDAMNVLAQRIEYITRVEQKEGRLAATLKTVREALENADYRNQGTILAMASAGSFLAAEALELTAEDFGLIQQSGF